MLKEQLVFNLLYKWKYAIAILQSKCIHKSRSSTFNSITYVAREDDKDWIFGAKVRRLAKFSNLNANTYFHNRLRDLPDSDGYFFVFHQYFYRAIRHNPKILRKKNIVMFTHPHWTFSFSKTHVIWCLNKADKVICLNTAVQKELIEGGLAPHKTEVLHIASDPDFFYPHQRSDGAVGFCSAYGERKNADLIFKIIQHLPEKECVIIGRHWEKYEHFDALSKLKNFTYYNNEPYERYPALYNTIDIFISASTLEGGPVPVLEAMLSNCFPIATKTGFCPDVIQHGENGYLFDSDASHETVIDLINRAATITTDVRSTALPYSWEACSKRLDALFLELS